MSRSLDILTDVCAELPVTVRKMFGGHGFFAPNGGMFAGIVTDDEVILKLEEGPARDELIAAGGHAWVYDGGPRPMTMASWIVVPDSFYDDPETFAAWARRAHELVPAKAARKPASKKPPARKSATKKSAAGKAKAPSRPPPARKSAAARTPAPRKATTTAAARRAGPRRPSKRR